MLEENTTIIHLHLDRNCFDDRGVKALVSAMAVNDTVQHLTVEGNNVGADVLEELSYAIMMNNQPLPLKKSMGVLTSDDPNCQVLDYSDGQDGPGGRRFDDNAVRIFCTTLLTHTHVHTINLSRNNITDEGAEFIADVLKINPHITSLNLANNLIGEKGGRALCAALRSNHTLAVLKLATEPAGTSGGNSIPPEVMESISAELHTNSTEVTAKVDRPKPRPDTIADQKEFRTLQYYGELESDILTDALKDKHLRNII